MDLLSREEMEALVQHRRTGPCISIYMPTQKASDVKQNAIRLKNLLSNAQEQLAMRNVRSTDRKKLLEPAMQLIGESVFWSNQSEGLAIFLAPGFARWYRLPFKFKEKSFVKDSFHIKPILALLAGDGQFYVLAISQKDARLLQGTRDVVEEIDIKDIIEKFELEFGDDIPEQHLQYHTPRQGDTRSAVYFGHGGEIDNIQKEKLMQYFRFIARELQGMLNQEKAPLILAGVEYLFPFYREANRYPLLLDEGIKGNPENISAEELHRRAWKIMEPYFQKNQDKAIRLYHQQKGTGKTSVNVLEVLPAAFHGRVETLFVAVGVQKWGSFDQSTSTVTLDPGPSPENEDLLDVAAAQTFLNNGTVYAVKPDEMPDTEPLAALFRY